jgi:hypothetical protein
MTLSASFGNDAAVAARIGDFCGVLTGLHYVGDLLGAQLRDHLRRQFILEWQRRLERGDELTSFLALRGLAPATSLDVARDDEASESGAATIAPSTPRSTSRRLPSRNRFAPVASLPEPMISGGDWQASRRSSKGDGSA